MIGNLRYVKNFALSFVLAGGMVGFATVARANDYSQDRVRDAQQQLQSDGYYKGSVDGAYGPMTRAAIRKYQRDNNLTVNGQLDRQTCDRLGLRSEGEANREQYQEGNANAAAPSTAAVRAAQRRLHDKGFYKGDYDGRLGPETRAAIREYQRNSNLNVTGRLDDGTLSQLGVSK
jgi:peptidoglycan hydrolase-like protein with peptidoglycan-binding domain